LCARPKAFSSDRLPAMSDTAHLGFWSTINTIYHDRYRCSGMVVQIAAIEGPLTPGLLRRALFLLQQRHPLLQATIEDDNRYYRFTRDTYAGKTHEEMLSAIPLRLVRRDSADRWRDVAEKELCRDFDKTCPCLWRVVLLSPEGSGARHELIMVFHHAVADALCGAHCLREILDLCSRCIDGHGPLRNSVPLPLLPAVEKMIPKHGAPPHQRSPEAASKPGPSPWRFEQYASLSQRTARLLYREIGPDVMARLKKRAEKEQATINSALTAALLLSTVQTKEGPCTVGFSTAVDLRRYCEPAIAHEHFGCHIMVLQTAPLVDPDGTLWELSRQCGSELAHETALKQRQGFLPKMFTKAFLTTAMTSNLSRADKEHHFPGGPALSNLGALDVPAAYGPFRLEGIYFTTCQLSGLYMLFVSVINFNGKLFCCFSFAEPLISVKTVQAVADRFTALLENAS